MYLFIKKNIYMLMLATTLMVVLILWLQHIDKKICEKANDYDSILSCINKDQVSNKDKIDYLNSKNKSLNNIDLFKYQKNMNNSYLLVSIYSSLIIEMNQFDRENLLGILNNNLDNDYALFLYLRVVELEKKKKLEIVKGYLNKYGVLSKYENCTYNHVYQTSYLYTKNNKIIEGYEKPECMK